MLLVSRAGPMTQAAGRTKPRPLLQATLLPLMALQVVLTSATHDGISVPETVCCADGSSEYDGVQKPPI